MKERGGASAEFLRKETFSGGGGGGVMNWSLGVSWGGNPRVSLLNETVRVWTPVLLLFGGGGGGEGWQRWVLPG